MSLLNASLSQRNGKVWGVARMNPAGDQIQPLKNKDTLPKLASLVLAENEEAKTYKDPEGKDIIVTGDELSLLEHQKALQQEAKHTGDAFIMRNAHHAYEGMKDAVSVNATFVDASMIEDDTSFIKQTRDIEHLDAHSYKNKEHHDKDAVKTSDDRSYSESKNPFKTQERQQDSAFPESSLANRNDLDTLTQILGFSASYMQITTFSPDTKKQHSKMSEPHMPEGKESVTLNKDDALNADIEDLVKAAFGDDVDVETEVVMEDALAPNASKESESVKTAAKDVAPKKADSLHPKTPNSHKAKTQKIQESPAHASNNNDPQPITAKTA